MTSKRIEKTQKQLSQWGCDAILIQDPINLYYLLNLQLSAGKLLIAKKSASLFVDGRYFEQCQKHSTTDVFLMNKSEVLKEFISQSPIKTLGFESDRTSYKEFLTLKKLLSTAKLKPLDAPITIQRAIKDKAEIELLRQAAKLGSEGFDYLCQQLKEGITEKELALMLELFWKKQGSKGLAFDPIIAFGANGAMPHYRASNVKLKKNDAILIDIGVNLDSYFSDMTRMVYFGKPKPRILEIHQIVQEAQSRALNLCKEGARIGDIDAAARDYISQKGFGENFSHGLGHGVGLEIHELPVLKNTSPYKDTILEAGMVVTIEPGIYVPGLGGVRIENSIVITKKGYEDLTDRPSNPKLVC